MFRSHAAAIGTLALSLAGTALAQTTRLDQLLDSRSPDGEPVQFVFREPFETIAGGLSPRTSGSIFINPGQLPEADGHSSAAFTTDGTKIIVANRDSKNLAIFNAATRALVAEIPLSGDPESVAVSPDGIHAATANMHTNTVSIVNIVTGVELGTVPVGAFPTRVRITPDGSLAVVNCSGDTTLHVIDIATRTNLRNTPSGGVLTTVSVNPETAALGFRAGGHTLAGNTTALVPDYNNSRVRKIDLLTGAITDIPTFANPADIAVVGNTAVVTHYFSVRQLTVIDIAAGTVTKTIAMPVDLWGPVTLNPLGTKAVVAIQNACKIVDLVTNAISADISTASVDALATTFDGQYAFCSGFRASLISFATGTLVKDLNNFVSAPIIAVSPVAHRAVLFSDTFGEDMVIVDTNGAAGSLLSAGPSGPVPEADSARTSAITADGSKIVLVNQRSQTASVVSTASRSVLATIPLDRRPGGVEISPNGAKAVVASRDGINATIIDLNSLTSVNVPISTRADEVEISPDSQFAYLAVVSGGDGVWRINLNTNTVQGAKLATGDMGSVGYAYQQFNGMRLSPNGATLVTTNGFPVGSPSISVIDTAAWAVVNTVALPANSLPARAEFSPDNSRIYVALRDTDSISVISNAGAASAVIGSIPVGDGPFEMSVSPDGTRLYVINFNASTIGVVNTATNTQIATIPFTAGHSITGLRVSADGSRLYAVSGTASITFGAGGFTTSEVGNFTTIDTATNTVIDTRSMGHAPTMLAMNASTTAAGAAPAPWGDGAALTLPCASDVNFDGFSDAIDYDTFVAAFVGGLPESDYNADGFPDAIDYDLFIAAWVAGC